MKSAIQSDSLEDLLLGLASHLDENYFDGKYKDIIKSLDAIVNIKDILGGKNLSSLQQALNNQNGLGNALDTYLPELGSTLKEYILSNDGAEFLHNVEVQCEYAA